MENNSHNKLAELEALLFIHGEPLALSKIAKILEVNKTETETLLQELKNTLENTQRGLSLTILGEKVQLVTKKEFSGILEKFVKEELSEELTPASLEALSLILYLGPISRSRVEYIRGVNSTFILRNLLLRGLVERSQDPQNTHIFLYAPTHTLMRHLGITHREELPDFERTQTLLHAFETQDQAEQNQ